MKLLIINNHDSFTFNLVDLIRKLNVPYDVLNVEDLKESAAKNYTHILISPGPDVPRAYPQLFSMLDKYYQQKSILGVCLGHQTLCEFFDTEVHNFYTHIQKELEAVVTGQKEESDFGGNMLNIDIGKEETEVYYQMDDESLGEPCFISTDELYKLVIEWKEMEEKMHRGEDIIPVILED